MDTLGLKLVDTLLSRLDVRVVGVVNDDLSTLYHEKVENLILELILDAPS
jgi:hypothetical protein